MKIQHPLLVRAIGATGAAVVRQLGRTLRYHFRYQDPTVDPEMARQTGQRYIYAFFHEVMLFPGLLLAMARDAHPDQRPPGRRVDHAGDPAARIQRDPRLDHAGRDAGPARDDPPGRPRPPLRDARRPARPQAIGSPGRRLSCQPDGVSGRRCRHGVQDDPGGRRAGTGSACPGRSARPRASFRRPSSSRPMRIARHSKTAAGRSEAGCKKRCSRPRHGSTSSEATGGAPATRRRRGSPCFGVVRSTVVSRIHEIHELHGCSTGRMKSGQVHCPVDRIALVSVRRPTKIVRPIRRP